MKIDGAFIYQQDGTFKPFTPIMAEYYAEELRPGDIVSGELTVNSKKGLRTKLQNSSLHLWFSKIAKACNEAGITIDKVMPKKLDIEVTPENFKETVWKPCQIAMYNIASSTKLNTKQLSDVAKAIDLRLLSNQGINIPWPCQDTQMREFEGREK